MESLTLSSEERNQYQQHFLNAGPADGKLAGPVARANLLQSGLSSHQLGDIWELADIDKDGALDFDEYCIALKIVFSLLHGKIGSVPPVLPPGLIPETKYAFFGASMVGGGVQGAAVTQSQHQSQSPGIGGSSGAGALEWYVPGDDRSRYESVFAQHSRGSSHVRALDVDEFLNSLGIPRSAVSQAWALVDVRKYQQLNLDQFVYLLHVLNAVRTRGAQIPATLPSAVKDNIYRSLNLDSGLGGAGEGGSGSGRGSAGLGDSSYGPAGGAHSYRYGKSSVSSSVPNSRTNKAGLYGEKSGNVALADSYLSKLKSSSTFKNEAGSRYASTSKNAEEEKRLRAELDGLDDELRMLNREDDQQQQEQEQRGDSSGDRAGLEATLKELERLRDQKKAEKKRIEEQIRDGTSPGDAAESVQDIKQTVYKLEGHLSFLLSEKRAMDSFISSAKQELLDLQMEQIKLK
ncbi:endocytosis defective- protein [Coemansia sp. Benny D160-2]|nr:endocytosis defective- protein [Coemansia sp. Benny D160-2]